MFRIFFLEMLLLVLLGRGGILCRISQRIFNSFQYDVPVGVYLTVLVCMLVVGMLKFGTKLFRQVDNSVQALQQ